MFYAVQVQLKNAVEVARSLMKLSNENHALLMRLIDLLSEKRYVRIGLGEDLKTVPDAAVVEADRIRVAADHQGAVEIVSQEFKYSFSVIIRDVVLEGEGLTYSVQKKMPDLSVRAFDAGRLPLQTDNFTLVVAIAPGGYFKKAAVLQEISV